MFVIPLDLRPLDMGEILDRAVTIFVRHFTILILISAVVSVPLAIVAYAIEPAQPDAAGLAVDTLKRIMTLPAAPVQETRAVVWNFSGLRSAAPRDLELALVSAILGLVSTTACVIAIAQIHAGMRPSARGVYREALRRFPAQLAASVVFAGFLFVAIAILFVVILTISVPFAAISAVWPQAAPLMIAFAALVVALVVLLETSVVTFTLQMMIVSIALEETQPMRGIVNGLQRTLSRPVLWRSTLVATITFVIFSTGSLLLLSIADGLSSVTHVSALSPVVSAIGDMALAALYTVFVVMYAFDVRVRREGYDLAIAALEAAL